MRDILNKLTLLAESVGLSNRKPGEEFANPDGHKLVFQSLDFYPESGAYPATQVSQALSSVLQNLGITNQDVVWSNQYRTNMGGFGLAHFIDQNNKDYYIGRWFQNISPNRIENNFPNNAIPGGYQYQSRRSTKEASNYKPSDILTEFQSNTPASILQQIEAKFGSDSDEVRATQTFMAAESFPITFPKGKINFTAFRDYFCELLQPCALVLNKPVRGNAQEAADIFFGPGADFSDCVISFNNSAIGGLYDSLLINSDGKQIKISSKGKSGASASAANLARSVRELESTPNGKKLVKKHREVIEILNTVERGGHFQGPLQIAVKYNIINEKESQQVLDLRGLGPDSDIIGSGRLSRRLEKMYQERQADDPSRIIPAEHMITAIAVKVCQYVNENTNFSSAASDILNNSALVQIYTEARETQDTISITGFQTQYPSNAVTGVLLQSGKTYFSTGSKGNLTFKILKNGATDQETKLNDVQVDTKPDVDLTYAVTKRSKIKAAAPEPKKDDSRALGRQRRKA